MCPPSRSGREPRAALAGAASQSSRRRTRRACRALPTRSSTLYPWRKETVRELLRTRSVQVAVENRQDRHDRHDRPRRLRANPQLRELVRETRLHAAQLVAPIFVVSGRGRREEIPSLKGHARLSPDLAAAEAERLAELGVGGVLLFGVPDSKDARGEGAADDSGPVPETLRKLKAANLPPVSAARACLCEEQ